MLPGFSNGMERPGITHIIREPQTSEEATKELGFMLINAKFSAATANTNYENNLVEKVKKLLKLGANPNGTQRVGEKYCKIDMGLCGSAQLSFLMYAIVLGYPKIVKLLLDAGANPNFKALTRPLAGPTEFTTPLLQASKSPTSTEIISLLLDHGANPNITTTHGRSPLMNAIALGSIDTIRQLLKHEADINFVIDYETALSVAVARNDLNIMRLLLENAADPNITDKSGVTALMYAAARKCSNGSTSS